MRSRHQCSKCSPSFFKKKSGLSGCWYAFHIYLFICKTRLGRFEALSREWKETVKIPFLWNNNSITHHRAGYCPSSWGQFCSYGTSETEVASMLYFTSSPMAMGSFNGWINWRTDPPAGWGGAPTRRCNGGRVHVRLCPALAAKLFRVFAAIKMTTVICGDVAGWRPKGFCFLENLLLTSVSYGKRGQCCFSIDSHALRILQIDYWIEMWHVVRTWRISSE